MTLGNRIKKSEKPYMNKICEEQISNLFKANIICLFYGIIAYIFIANSVFHSVENGKRIYFVYLSNSVALMAYMIIGNCIIKKENTEARYKYCNIAMILTTQLYFNWAHHATYYNYLDSGVIDILPWIMVFGVCVTSFFYKLKHFIILISFNFLMMIVVAAVTYNHGTIRYSFVNSMVFIVILLYIYLFKHFKELRVYEDQMEYERVQNSKNLLTASMNHELRTPLNSIIGNAQIMLSRKDLTDEERKITDNIFNSSKVMVQLVNDLLDYSKMEAGEFQIIKGPFDITALKDNIYSMMNQLAKEKNLDFKISIEEMTPVTLIGDARRIQQIVINIISNGIKYTKEGSVKCNFSVDGYLLKIVVIDTGMGMTKDTIEDLFTPYKRFDEEKNKNIQGTGLGMFVVKQLLTSMNGSIKVDSVPDLGTTMVVTIPIDIKENSQIYRKNFEHKTDEAVEEIKYDFTGKTILSVDDTVINNKIVQNILESVGATTYAVLDGENCLKFLEQQNVDLILLDHIMPGIQGVEVLNIIRNSEKAYKDVPIVMLSGNADEKSQELYKKSGANGWLSKPIMVDQLFEMVDSIFQNEK